jgi:hypothetical protein
VKLRCHLLSLLKAHPPDCQYCAREKYGIEMRKRLEELNWRTQPHSPINANREQIARALDSKQDEVVSGKPAA